MLLVAGAAERSSAQGVGCLFLAHRGAGAYVAPMSGQSAGSSISAGQAGLERIHVQDESDMQQARFMESYESRHSDHSFTAAVVSGVPTLVRCAWATFVLLGRQHPSCLPACDFCTLQHPVLGSPGVAVNAVWRVWCAWCLVFSC